MSNRILYVKPCWGVFRDGDRRTRAAYPTSASAIRHALQGAAGSVEIVVLDEDGKVTERLTRASRQAGAAELRVTDEMVERAWAAYYAARDLAQDETDAVMRAALEAALR